MPERHHVNPWLVLVLVCLGQFMVIPIAAGGGAFGLLLGGILVQTLSWEWIFFVNVPVGVVAALLAWRYVPESRAENRPDSFDLAGAVSVTAGLVVLVYAIVKAEEFGWGSARTLGLAAIALALLAAFVAIERRSVAPLVRLGIFRVRSLLGANLVLLVVAGGLYANVFFSSIDVHRILGWDALETGLAFLPITVGIVIGSGCRPCWCATATSRTSIPPVPVMPGA